MELGSGDKISHEAPHNAFTDGAVIETDGPALSEKKQKAMFQTMESCV